MIVSNDTIKGGIFDVFSFGFMEYSSALGRTLTFVSELRL
jgi:hypothetical protein